MVCSAQATDTSISFQCVEWFSINIQVNCLAKTDEFSKKIKTFFVLILNSEQTELLLQEIRENELNNPKGTHLQKLMSRFTLNTLCGMILMNYFTFHIIKIQILMHV